MARTLIIKNADFSVNKLDTVIFNDKSCTEITLDRSSISITEIGETETLVATTVPDDTTDAVIWTSSDPDVAVVTGGVVTAIGCGTATITATCGQHSDSCEITVTHIYAIADNYALNRYLGKDDSKIYLTGGDLNNYAIIYSAIGENIRRISYGDRQLDRYPILIPKGAKKITISCTSFKPYGFWLDSLTDGGMSTIAYALPKNEFGDSLPNAGSRTVVIPEKTGDYANLNSVALVLRSMNSTISDSAIEEVTVTFTA